MPVVSLAEDGGSGRQQPPSPTPSSSPSVRPSESPRPLETERPAPTSRPSSPTGDEGGRAAGATKAPERLDPNRIHGDRCAAIEDGIKKREEVLSKETTNPAKRFQAMHDRLASLVTRISTQGYDTTKIKVDLATLNQQIAEFTTAYNAYTTGLSTTQQYACGQSEGKFLSTLESTRSKLKELRTKAAAIQNFYQTVIRKDVVALKQQKGGSDTEASPSPRPVPSPRSVLSPRPSTTAEHDHPTSTP